MTPDKSGTFLLFLRKDSGTQQLINKIPNNCGINDGGNVQINYSCSC